MNIYSAEQIKHWDAYTIQHEPISSIELMERASLKCVDWILSKNFNQAFKIFCGKGNNGGDGLAIARLLAEKRIVVDVYILEFGRLGTDDFQANLQRLHQLPVNIHFLQSADLFPEIKESDIVIDALYGSGLNKPLEGLSAQLATCINASKARVISIDVPSGLYLDKSSSGNTIIHAAYTLTFQTIKLALLVAENAPYIGEVIVLDIGLHKDYLQQQSSAYRLIDEALIKQIFRPRQRFAHKGTFGHALIIGGSIGKIGALVLAVKACLRSGAGLVTAYLPACGCTVMQTAAPEAMALIAEGREFIQGIPQNLEPFAAIGIGTGLGTGASVQKAVGQLLQAYSKPLVVDADALNCLSLQKTLLTRLPEYSILTPHPKEFERLFGATANDFQKIELAIKNSIELRVIIVLKGHHTLIALPDGSAYFNNTGNAGMAKGGSGDVLTGMLTAFLAQGYAPQDAAILAVYLHGLAGDLAATTLSKEAMTALDIISSLSGGFHQLNQMKQSDH